MMDDQPLKEFGETDRKLLAARPRHDATCRVWESGEVWLWEVSSGAGDNLGFGRAPARAKARAAAQRVQGPLHEPEDPCTRLCGIADLFGDMLPEPRMHQ
jgi:hypothetical protein